MIAGWPPVHMARKCVDTVATPGAMAPKMSMMGEKGRDVRTVVRYHALLNFSSGIL